MSYNFGALTNPSRFSTHISNRQRTTIQDYSGLIDNEARFIPGMNGAIIFFGMILQTNGKLVENV